ncbi:MAG: glycosyltransferase family 4 protein [Anaerolineae bacterium]|nr:glycosyltransferase family 4 protein [Anaerolineae bacterium]
MTNTIPPNATIACTIISKNYLAAARTLVNSLRQFHDNIYPVVLLVDIIDGDFDPAAENFQTMLAQDLGIPRWSHFAMKYDIMELNTAVKPYLLEVLFDRFEAQKVIYFDPDIVIYHQLDELLSLLDEHGVVLTPHLLDPLDDDFSPSELNILQAGTFNLGFIALARKYQWRELLQWWQKRLYNNCTREIDKGMFVDQHWADLMPSLYDGVYILRNPGYNLAYWNFKTRDLQHGPDGYYVDSPENPLIFFHFSGFSVDNLDAVSKHQDRFVMSQLNTAYHQIFADYRQRLLDNDYHNTRKLPYFYGKFSDGVPIPDILRICLRMQDIDGQRWPDPYDIESPQNFREWATSPTPNGYVSPYLLTLREVATYLKEAFPSLSEINEIAYANWFVMNESTEAIFHPFYRAPIKAALKKVKRAEQFSISETVIEANNGRHILSTGILSPHLAPSGMGGRWTQTVRYYRRFPASVKPFLPPNLLDAPPAIYTGPGGFYGTIRRQLLQMGVLNQVRRMVGLRLIMTARFYAQFPRMNTIASGFQYPNKPPLQPASPHLLAPSSKPPDDLEIKEGTNIVGFIRSETGIGQIARNLMKSLEAVNFPIAALPVEAYDPARKEDFTADQYHQGTPYTVNVFQVNADMTFPVRDVLPQHVYERHYNIGYWAWELDHFPDDWQHCFDVYNEIWVFSGFVQRAIAKSAPVPVVLMPVSFPIELPKVISRAKFGLPEDAFLALFVFNADSIIERKNPWATIRAFAEAFTPEERKEKARLVIKVNRIGNFPAEAARLREELSQVNGILLEDYLSREDTYALIKTCDVYISLHRSEGYGMTLAEAMTMGRPVIGTAYSGNMDFMNINTSYLIPYDLVTITENYHPYRAGNVWAEPDIHAAARALREVYEHPEIAAEKGRAAAEYMRRFHNPQVVGEATANRIRYILKRLSK